jgi:hypothetical protein
MKCFFGTVIIKCIYLSPFGDEMLFWYSDNQMYLFYALDRHTIKEPTYKRYYWGYINKKR